MENSGAKKPDSIKEALKILDNALSARTATLQEMVGEDYKNIKSAIGETSEQFVNTATESFGDLTDSLKTIGLESLNSFAKLSEDSAGSVSDVVERGRAVVGEIAKEVDAKLRANPWPAIGGIAIGTLALGYLLGRGARPESKANEAKDSTTDNEATADAARAHS